MNVTRGTKGIRVKPRNVMIYGEHGTGKTTLASTFPGVYLIDVEGGSDDIDILRSPRVASYADFETEINWLLTESEGIRTVAIDSVDWLEKLVQRHVANAGKKDSIEEFGYGKGYTYAAELFEKIILSMRSLNAKGMAVLLLGHAKSVRHSPPDGESFERWEPDLHDKIQSPLVEFCDEVLFLKKLTYSKKEELGFNKTRTVAVSTDQRVLVCSDTGSVVAKNRLRMPNEIPATFNDYASYVLAARGQAMDSEGIVDNGVVKPPKTEAGAELAETNVF